MMIFKQQFAYVFWKIFIDLSIYFLYKTTKSHQINLKIQKAKQNIIFKFDKKQLDLYKQVSEPILKYLEDNNKYKASHIKLSLKNAKTKFTLSQEINNKRTVKLMSFSNNLQLTSQPIKTIQCQRIFNLIQQNINIPSRVLTQNSLQQFLKFITPQSQTKAIQLRQLLGQQLTMQRFANTLVALTHDIPLTNQQSLRQYYHRLKSILLSSEIKHLQRFQQWDRSQNVNNQDVQKIKSNIEEFLSRLLPYLDGMEIFTFQNSLQQINYCLSAITLPNMNEDDIIKVYRQLVNTTVLGHVSQFLTGLAQILEKPNFSTDLIQQADNITNYISLICYLYTACSLKPIRQKLSSQSCLFYIQTYAIIITGLNIPQPKIKKQISICIALMAKYDEKFIQWLFTGGVENNLTKMLNVFDSLTDNQGLYYAIVSLKHVIRVVNNCKLGSSNNTSPNSFYINNNVTLPLQPLTNITEPILQYTLKTLKTAQFIQTQQQCLYLISQIIKIHPITYSQLQQIKLTTKVYLTPPNLQSLLVPPTLMILENSIIYGKIDIVHITIHDHGFLTCLQQNIENKQSQFYYQLLNILYLLSQKEPKFITDKVNLLQKIINMIINDMNPSISSLTTQMLLNIINYAIQSQTILQILYDKYGLFQKLLPLMFKKCFNQNDFIVQLLSNNQQNFFNHNYFDKTMLMTIFQILYVLAVSIPRKHKRYSFNKKLNQLIIRSIGSILADLFKSENRSLMQFILRQKIFITAKKLKSQTGIAFYKLVNILFQQMTYGMQHRPIQFLRIINQQKKNYSTALLLSSFFTIHELQIQNIPIYLNLQLTFQSNTIIRTIPHKFELTSVKCYIKQFIAKIAQIKQQQIKDIILRQSDTMRIVQNQVQYRTIVNKSIQNKIIIIKFQVIDIKLKPRRDQMMSMSYINLSGQGLSRSTIRDNRSNSFVGRQLSRGTSVLGQSTVSRFTPLRQQPSQFHQQRKSFYSPINFNYSNYREKSPVFGGGNRNK